MRTRALKCYDSSIRANNNPSRRMALLLAAVTAGITRGNVANGDPRLEQLFRRFIAPCCWRENLFVHQSPKADELRAAIRRDVAAGKTDAEIQQGLVREYSTRVLAMPEGAARAWLQWTPLLAGMMGVGAIGWFVRRSIQNAPVVVDGPVAPLPVELEEEQ
jgi:cytochrome c-type biogenesis protein CcmH